jgi:4-amino-4-deoxy-L-arabinose transferase-like glycosyltransferase
MNVNQPPPRAAATPRRAFAARAAWQPALLALLLGLLALLPRTLGLADFLTTDEVYHWIARTERFATAVADHHWAATNQTGHPGVTLMWLGSLGLALERLAVGQGWSGAPAPVEHLAWLRLPGALLEALLVPAGYLLLRRLLVPMAALLAGLLWATSPYLIAHARLLHLDALLTSFVTISVLLLLVATSVQTFKRSNVQTLIGSGIFAGLALLTKGPALILLPFAGLLLFFTTKDKGQRTKDEGSWASSLVRLPTFIFRQVWAILPLYLLWLGTALLVVALLWPALWVDPAGALYNYLDEILSNGGRPNGDGQFFLGRTVGDPGPLFYPIADLFRMTPATLLGLLGLPLVLRRQTEVEDRGSPIAPDDLRSSILDPRRTSRQRRALLALGAFALFWTLVMTLGPKKFDRYVLPTWPAIEILAAAGLAGMLQFGCWLLNGGIGKSTILVAIAAVGLTLNLAWYHPYYLSYYNPLLGGGAGAQRALLIGWGEGMDQAGAWLGEQRDIGGGPVLAALGPTLQPFVPAPVRDVTDLGTTPANYAVAYVESLQRGANSQIYTAIEQTVPLHTVTIHGIEYARIYQLPRPYEQTVGARWGDALRLAGVTIARANRQLVVTPAWDVRATPAAEYHVFLHLLDSGGQRVAQVDVAPGGADFPPTSAWQPGRQIAVPLPLPLPANLPHGTYRLVIGLYDIGTNQRPPLTEGPAADPSLDGPSVVLLDTLTLP